MAAILKNDRKMPFYQKKKSNPMFFCLFIPLTCIINEKNQFAQKNPTPLHICPYYKAGKLQFEYQALFFSFNIKNL